jgi:hypothetical protein
MKANDKRRFNVAPNSRTPKKDDGERSRPYQFRLNPSDSPEERALRDFIRDEQSDGKTIRQIVLELHKEYTAKPKPAEIEQGDYHEMLEAVRWIVGQIETGALAQSTKSSGGKRAKLPEIPDNVTTLFSRLKTKGASAQSLQIDEDE